MDDVRYASGNKPTTAMQNDGVAGSGKPSPSPLLERFRAALREREDELRVAEGVENGVVLSTDEIVRLYEMVLSELMLNSKPIITDLTIIAGEQRAHADGIADAICARILEVPVQLKLPTLYLVDSIVKNIGRVYVKYFSARLPEVFCEAYRQVHPNKHTAIRHLFGTWSTVFPSSVLHQIESQLQLTPLVDHQSSGLPHLRPAESPQPTRGIHVNPKYLEARRQFGHSTVDANIQPLRGTSSTAKVYGLKPSIESDERNADDDEANASQVKATRLSSRVHAGPASVDTLKLPLSLGTGIKRSLSPYRVEFVRSLSPSLPPEEFAVDYSPKTVAGSASPSKSGFDCGISRVMGNDEGADDWKRNFPSGITKQQVKHSAAFRYNEVDLQRPRALIDAYGIDKRQDMSNHKHPKVERTDVNGIDRIRATKTWQNTEEEEFDWEDMSPTFADNGRHKDVFSSSLPSSGSFRTTTTLGTHNAAPLVPNVQHDWSSRAQPSVVNGSSMIGNVSSISSSDGLNDMISGICKPTQVQGTRYVESWKLVQNQDHSSKQRPDATIGGKNFHMPFPGSGTLPSAADCKLPLVGSHPDANAPNHRPPFASTIESSTFDYLTPEIQVATASASTGAWPHASLHNSHAPPLLPTFRPNKQMRGPHDNWFGGNVVTNEDVKKSTFPEHFPHITGSKLQNSLPQLSSQQSGPIALNQHYLGPRTLLPQQPPLSQDVRRNVIPPSFSLPSPLLAPQLNRGYAPPLHISSIGTSIPNSVPILQSSMPILSVPNTSTHLPGVSLPHLPRGPLPPASRPLPVLQNPTPVAPNPLGGGGYSGLFNSLMAQGLISLTDQAPAQDSVGLEFNLDLLKVRHESSITALYADLSRQCTTCGLRFKYQEAHSSHMDWHVTKNRVAKNRKQKPSRKWFVNVNMWLTGAEALKTDTVPGFLPTENVVETKDDEELAVPADDDQKVCALCGEPFDDYYSDETEEWMYKGAVYMNAPTGSTAGMDRSQLGPIIHVKCRSETGGVSFEDVRKN